LLALAQELEALEKVTVTVAAGAAPRETRETDTMINMVNI